MKVRLFTFLLLLLSLHIGRAQTENILLTGEIVNRQNDAPPSIEVCLCDWFNHTVRTNVLIEANGSFRSRLRFTVGHTFAIKYRDTFYAYAAPGDSLHLVIDDRTQAVAFSGDHDALARLYHCYGQDISPFVNDQIRKFTDDTLPLDQQMKFFTGIYRLVEDSIAAYCHRQDIDDHERKLLNTEANSRPITPAPITHRLEGTWSMSSISREDRSPRRSPPGTFREAEEEPVATMI